MNLSLPRMAWITRVDRKKLLVSALFGNNVERGHDFLVAGVWNGPFSAGDFGSTDCFFGTGVIVRENSVIFVSGAGINDAIYYAEDRGCFIAANSLPLLLAATEDTLDPHFAFYDRIAESIRAGFDGYEKCIPTAK